MIEVEKKFLITEAQFGAVTKLANFVKQSEFTDVYFDTRDWWLTLHDKWLRRRDDRFELKVPVAGEKRLVNVYREIVSPADIAGELRLKTIKPDFAANILANGLASFCRITTRRKKYRYRGFTIDVSDMDFGYSVCEIEKMVRSRANVGKAAEEILSLAARLGLEVKPVYGKVIEYLRRHNLRHFRALRKAGVIT